MQGSCCGCPASSHPVCPAWQAQQEAKKREEEQSFRRWRQQQEQRRSTLGKQDTELRDAWARLQLRPGATEGQLRASYKRLARMYHPDKNRPGAEDGRNFIELTNSFRLLQRSVYGKSV